MFSRDKMIDLLTEYVIKGRRVQDLCEVLRKDPYSGMSDIEYFADADHKREIVRITYKGGHTEYINVAFNSVGAIFCEIVNQVYRGSSVGLIASPEGRKIAEKWIRERELNEEQESDEQTGQSSLAAR